MQFDQVPSGSGFVFQVDRRNGPVWYAKYRLLDGRQVKKKIGPAWKGRGRPAVGFFSERSANDWLDDVLARVRDEIAGGRSTNDDVSFAEAAREWLRYCEQDRSCKPSTMRGYRSSVEGRLIPTFGAMRAADVTALHCDEGQLVSFDEGWMGPRVSRGLLSALHRCVSCST